MTGQHERDCSVLAMDDAVLLDRVHAVRVARLKRFRGHFAQLRRADSCCLEPSICLIGAVDVVHEWFTILVMVGKSEQVHRERSVQDRGRKWPSVVMHVLGRSVPVMAIQV